MSGFMQCMRVLLMLVPVAAWPGAQALGQDAGDPQVLMLWQPGDPGERLFLRGRVVDGQRRPVSGATVYIRQADGTGSYREQRYRARLETSGDGSFGIATVLPGQYMGPKHIHVGVEHPAHPSLDARIVFKGDPNLGRGQIRDIPILLEESRREGETVLLGEVELVLGTAASN